MAMYFLTIHDITGKRVDDESDNILTEAEVDAYLKYYTFGEVEIADQKLYRTCDENVLVGIVSMDS